MQEKKTERAPGSYEDFVAYLGTVRTEEELFSPLTYWFVGQNCPEDVCFRPQLVEARAKELGFWQGLTFKVEHWMTTSRAEAEAAGREAFQSRIGEDYAAYREKAEAARERARRRRLSSPFLYIPKCLDDIPVRDVSWLVEGLLPQGEVSLLGADGYPYGLPIDYWYNEADGKLYFHGAKEGHKIDAIRACDKASFCIHDEGVRMDGEWPLHFRSVIVFGRIAPVTDEAATALACKELSRKFTPDDEYFNKEYAAAKDRVLCLALTPEHITGKRIKEN